MHHPSKDQSEYHYRWHLKIIYRDLRLGLSRRLADTIPLTQSIPVDPMLTFRIFSFD